MRVRDFAPMPQVTEQDVHEPHRLQLASTGQGPPTLHGMRLSSTAFGLHVTSPPQEPVLQVRRARWRPLPQVMGQASSVDHGDHEVSTGQQGSASQAADTVMFCPEGVLSHPPSLPPHEAGMHSRVRVREPPDPHEMEQSEKALHALQAASVGQHVPLSQGAVSVAVDPAASPSQVGAPLQDPAVHVRVRVYVPLPQVAEQDDQVPHADHAASTGQHPRLHWIARDAFSLIDAAPHMRFAGWVQGLPEAVHVLSWLYVPAPQDAEHVETVPQADHCGKVQHAALSQTSRKLHISGPALGAHSQPAGSVQRASSPMLAPSTGCAHTAARIAAASMTSFAPIVCVCVFVCLCVCVLCVSV